jgi:gamma-glutamylputrescine oxidase
VHERLHGYLRDELLVAAPVSHHWVGLVGYADDPLPTVGPAADGVYALGGYNGTGNVQGFVAARIVSELIVDGSSSDAWLYQPPIRVG